MFALNPLAKPFVPMGARLLGCSARPMLVRQMAVPNKVILQALIVPEDIVVTEEAKGTIVEKEKEEEKKWKEERMKSWLDSAITAPPPDDRHRIMEELDRDIEVTWENIHKINRNYCE